MKVVRYKIPSKWIVDYGAAREQAIRRLGDRYLLAKPINVRSVPWRPTPRDEGVPPVNGASASLV